MNLKDINISSIFYSEKVKNTVMDDSNFVRIIYSNNLFTLNNIFISLIFNINNIERSFNKYKCILKHDSHNNKTNIERIKYIEKNILTNCNIKKKTPNYRISEQLNNGFLKLFKDFECKEHNNFILKIYGIWETDIEYGITYKFEIIQ